MIKYYAILGYPVSHSHSPDIYNYLFGKYAVDGLYVRLSSLNAVRALDMIKEYRFSGFNITTPFKRDIYKLSKKEMTAPDLSALPTLQYSKRNI